MTLPLMPNPRQQFFGSDGKPLAGGKVYTYAAGTSTPKATYTDAAGTTPNANPIILNARGEATVFWNGTYKVTLTDSSGATIYTQDNIASLDAGVRADLASTDTDKGAALVSFKSSQTLRVLDTVQPYRLSIELGAGGGNEYSKFNELILKMNADQRPLIIDRDISISDFTAINGYCVVSCEGDATITFTGGSAGFLAINTSTLLGSWTAVPTLVQWPVSSPSTGSYVTALTVDSATYAALSTGDNVYLSDSVNNTFVYGSTNYTNLAEIAMVVEKSGGTTIYLDRVLGEWNRYSASGTVTKLGDNPCRLQLNINGERTTPRELIRVEGYARAQIDAVINGNSSRGVMLVGCLAPRVRAFVDNLRDYEGGSPASYGYGICAAAATTDGQFEVNAKRVRHAYSDIILGTTDGLSQPLVFKGGVVRRSSVTGVADSCTAASWDTHPFSDRVRFENVKAWGTHNVVTEQSSSGLNCAMQVRGTNVTVDGLETNLQVGIRYSVDACRNSILDISNFRHHNTIPDGVSTTSANSLISFSGTSKSGASTHKVNIRNSMFHNMLYAGNDWNFLSVYGSEVNMGTSTSGWPGMNSQTGCVTEYINTIVREPASMNISAGLTLEGGKVVKANTNGFILLDGAVLKSRNHCVEITGGGSSINSAYAYSSLGAGTTASFTYSNVSVDDARASGINRPFVYTSAGATITVKDITASADIYATATVDLPNIAAQGTTTFDVTVPGVATGIVWLVTVNPSADLGALAMTAWVQAANTVRVRVVNPTAAPIDAASVTMTVVARRAV